MQCTFTLLWKPKPLCAISGILFLIFLLNTEGAIKTVKAIHVPASQSALERYFQMYYFHLIFVGEKHYLHAPLILCCYSGGSSEWGLQGGRKRPSIQLQDEFFFVVDVVFIFVFCNLRVIFPGTFCILHPF